MAIVDFSGGSQPGSGGGGGGGGDVENAVLYTAQSLSSSQKLQARTNIGAGTYSKPSGGIPASDLASGVVPDVSGLYTKPASGIPASDLASGVIPDVSGKYEKPSGGIPATDLASDVQTSLGKADTAYQKPVSGIPASDLASGVIPDTSGLYTKPASGIPASDLAAGVIPAAVEANPVVPSGTTPTDLTNLKVGDSYYAIPQGSGGGGGGSTENAVLYSAQSLNSTQQAQARTNIGAGTYSKPAEGIPAADLASGVVPDVSGKADKVSGAVNGNFAGLDSNGNLTDSGKKASDFLTSHQDITGKADKVSSPTSGNFAGLDSNGNLTDSGSKASDFATAAQGSLAATAIQPSLTAGLLKNDGTVDTTAYGTYSKPSGGIPASDLATGVIPDVTGKADKNTTPTVYIVPDSSNLSGETLDALKDGDIVSDNGHDSVVCYCASNEIRTVSISENIIYTYKKTGGVWSLDGYAALVPTPVSVEANPTVPAGTTPTALSGLKVGSSYYSTPDVSGKENTSNKVTSLSSSSTDTQYPSAKAVYDEVNPPLGTTQPAGGFLPGKVYDLGTLTGTVTFALATPTNANVANPYHWTFETGGTAPTVSWPSGVIWPDGVTPSVEAGKHYEILIRKGYGTIQTFTVPSA